MNEFLLYDGTATETASIIKWEPRTNILVNYSNHSKEDMPWVCYLIKDEREICYIPSKIENVPNAFQRFMLKIFFNIVWAKR